MKARDIMTQNPECVTADAPVRRAAQIMRDQECGIVPVVDDERSMRLTGVLTDRDIAIRCVAEGRESDCRVAEVMSSGRLDTVTPDAGVDEVMRLMERDQVRRVPVVEKGDRIVGIIAQADVALHVRDDREVGEVVERISEPGRQGGF